MSGRSVTSRKVISSSDERSVGRIVIFPNCWTRKRRSVPSGGIARATGSLMFWPLKVSVILISGAARRIDVVRRKVAMVFMGEIVTEEDGTSKVDFSWQIRSLSGIFW